MKDETHSHPSPPSETSPSLEIRCRECHYDLTGLTMDRCPECGVPFDRGELSRCLLEPSQPLPYGGLRGQHASFGQILYASLFEPTKLGRDLPCRPDSETATAYGFVSRSAAFGLMVLPLSILIKGEGLGPILLMGIAVMIVSHLCEVVIAGSLSRYVQPCNVPRHGRYRFWRTMCNCFSTHLPIAVGLTVPLACLLVMMEAQVVSLVFISIPPLISLWWWWCLGQAISKRGLRSTGKTAVILLIPVICLVVVIVSYVVLGLAVSALKG